MKADRQTSRLFACIAACLCAGLIDAHAATTSVPTRYGTVAAIPVDGADPAASEIRLDGKPVVRIAGSAELYKLALALPSDVVLADAATPAADCHHAYVLLELSSGRTTVSPPFGACMTLFGARVVDGKPVIQLAARAMPARDEKSVHEFMSSGGKLEESATVLTYCAALDLGAQMKPETAASTRSVTAGGRAFFHSAPADDCATPTFIVAGDVVTVRREYADYAAIDYRNPRTGQAFSGWVKRSRLAAAVAR